MAADEKDQDSIEVPGAEIPTGVDNDNDDAKDAGSPGTLEGLAADAMDEHRKDKNDDD
jgi:hypothetical protein